MQWCIRRGYKSWEPTANDFLTHLRGAVAGGAAGWCSFDLEAKRLFDQLDPEEWKVVAGVKAILNNSGIRYDIRK